MKSNKQRKLLWNSNKEKAVELREENGPMGFEEAISVSNDFKADEIKFKQFSTSFSISGEAKKSIDGSIANTSINRFRYTRVFIRSIDDSKIKIAQGTATVIGRFSYITKTSQRY